MSFIGKAFGIGGANISSPVTAADLEAARNNVSAGMNQQQAFIQALQGQGGIQNQSNIYNQLGQIAQGQGPNPAQAQLAQATGANVANQAALAAGQRGAGQNVGMLARGAAQQGANLQQQAAGQAATLQAQQSLGALGQQAGIAGQQVGNLGSATNAFTQAGLQRQSTAVQGQNAFNQAQVANQAMQNEANAKIYGGLMSGISSAATAGFAPGVAAAGKGGGGLEISPGSDNSVAAANQNYASGGQVKDPFEYFSEGGAVPAMVSPGEAYIPPHNVEKVAKGKASVKEAGEIIKGKAKVKGDSIKNDTVPKTLQEGGVVVPRSKMKNEDTAAKFVAAIMSKSHGKGLKR